MKSLYDYIDYREFLRDYIEEQKKVKSYFSYRFIGNKLKIDPSNIAKAVQGKRHLSANAVDEFSKFIGFNRREARYFRAVVLYAKEVRSEEKDDLWKKLNKIRFVTPHKIVSPQYEYYQKWYHSAMLALLYFYDFKDDYERLAQKLEPSISEAEARYSIKLLEELQLITKDGDGIYHHKENLITTGDDWDAVSIGKFQHDTLELAQRSLQNHKTDDRDISTVTVTASKTDIDLIREATNRYRKEVLRIVEESQDSEAVYQLNIQLFPLTKVRL